MRARRGGAALLRQQMSPRMPAPPAATTMRRATTRWTWRSSGLGRVATRAHRGSRLLGPQHRSKSMRKRACMAETTATTAPQRRRTTTQRRMLSLQRRAQMARTQRWKAQMAQTLASQEPRRRLRGAAAALAGARGKSRTMPWWWQKSRICLSKQRSKPLSHPTRASSAWRTRQRRPQARSPPMRRRRALWRSTMAARAKPTLRVAALPSATAAPPPPRSRASSSSSCASCCSPPPPTACQATTKRGSALT